MLCFNVFKSESVRLLEKHLKNPILKLFVTLFLKLGSGQHYCMCSLFSEVRSVFIVDCLDTVSCVNVYDNHA